jgi:hypothetical protein
VPQPTFLSFSEQAGPSTFSRSPNSFVSPSSGTKGRVRWRGYRMDPSRPKSPCLRTCQSFLRARKSVFSDGEQIYLPPTQYIPSSLASSLENKISLVKVKFYEYRYRELESLNLFHLNFTPDCRVMLFANATSLEIYLQSYMLKYKYSQCHTLLHKNSGSDSRAQSSSRKFVKGSSGRESSSQYPKVT